jgi:hypothetical protein
MRGGVSMAGSEMMGSKYSAEWWGKITGLSREISTPDDSSSDVADFIQATAKPSPTEKTERDLGLVCENREGNLAWRRPCVEHGYSASRRNLWVSLAFSASWRPSFILRPNCISRMGASFGTSKTLRRLLANKGLDPESINATRFCTKWSAPKTTKRPMLQHTLF